jgi:hypothetical protein
VTDNRLFSIPNPFSDAAVGSVWDDDAVDVSLIHAGVSASLMQMIDERARGHHHRCVLLHGDAGAGKTHVLRRLRFAVERDTSRMVPFSWVRMQTSPSMMWRHVRRTFASDLTMRPFRGGTQLESALRASRDKIDSVTNRDLALVLEHLAEGRHRRDARAWLAGSSLPDAALTEMGLAIPDAEEESAEDESRHIVFALAAFLAPAPAVLCLDQLEALQSYPGDQNGLFAIGKLLAAIHDEARNVVAIGCVQTGLLRELESKLSKAERDRYQDRPLTPLKREETRALVEARLESSRELAMIRPAVAPKYWPIDIARLEPLVGSREGVGPRRIIFECEQMFRAAQNLQLDTTPLADRLAEKFQERLAEAQRELTRDISAGVLSDGVPRLLHVRGTRTKRPALPKWVDHAWSEEGGRDTLVVVANEDPRVLWRKLRRITQEWNGTEADLVIVRDAFNPLRATAMGSQSRLAELQKRGARLVNPSREALIALDAARRLLADVESGDLTYRGEKIPVSTVEGWVREHMPGPVSRLLDEITREQAREDGALRMGLAAYLAENKVAALEDASRDLHCPARKLEECAHQSPDQFGFLAGAEPVVFERIPAEPGT